MKKSVIHLTSVHKRNDTRIFLKECKSLEQAGYDLSLIVADGLGNEIIDNVKIFDVGKLEGRFRRFTKTTKKVFNKAVELDGDLYHLHDPELMPIGIKLKKLNKKVIFDAHEDLPKQLLSKPYLNKVILKMASILLSQYEKYATKKFDYVVTATPFISNKFLHLGVKSIDVNNYPIIKELNNSVSWKDKNDEVCYIGGISTIRGIREVVFAFNKLDSIRLNLAGDYGEKGLKKELMNIKGWNAVNEYGFVDRNEVNDILSRSKAGLVTLYPTINYQDALPVKMFEYMLSGIPVISSNIPLWKKIVEKNNCGICVDPLNPTEISEAITFIVNKPELAKKMGDNGKKAVLSKYNWANEKEKLISVYKEIL